METILLYILLKLKMFNCGFKKQKQDRNLTEIDNIKIKTTIFHIIVAQIYRAAHKG